MQKRTNIGPNKPKPIALTCPEGKTVIYPSVNKAAAALGCEMINVTRAAKGLRRVVQGHKAEFVELVD